MVIFGVRISAIRKMQFLFVCFLRCLLQHP